jgi:enoyl-[acyl-carrier protein] reductase I
VRYLAWDLGRRNIRVNCLSAGPVRTRSSAAIAGFDELSEHVVRKSPLGRSVEVKDLGTTALYLLGELSGGVTGETIHVDCGYSIVGL